MSAPAERPWTPGPWAWRTTALSGESGHDGEFVINYRLASAGDVGIRICVADTIRKSDAALIALAPELVEALEFCERVLGSGEGLPEDCPDTYAERAACALLMLRLALSRLPQGGAS